ncbi:MAG: FAD-dependent thymidylate synthase [Clostridia bacterium]|nr:FAD-dependent thymidylate synthase [Clostridia bacterium]
MGKVTIFPETSVRPITLIGSRAGCCWGADVSDDAKNYKRGLDCIVSNHGRTLEYVNVEMLLDGYSARVIREWYTHIGGAPTRLQASTRYIDYSDFEYVTPPKIAADPRAKEIYDRVMGEISAAGKELEELGIPREDSAMVLPLGMTTKIVDRRNLRNLIDMSRQRMCTRAYHEYRELFSDICAALSEYSEEWKYIIDTQMKPKCEVLGYCTEKYSCGRRPKAEK